MPQDYVALRPGKHGELRGYSRDIEKPIPRKRHDILPARWESMREYDVPDTTTAYDVVTLLDCGEILKEMRKNMPNRKIRKQRKELMIKEWLEHGDPDKSKLFRIRFRQGKRNPI